MTGRQKPAGPTPSLAAPLAGAEATPPPEADPQAAAATADAVAAAVLAVPGVTGLHSGTFGEVATYLPGRRVIGVKTGADLTEVHLVVAPDVPVLPIAQRVRDAVRPLVATPVDVYVEDIQPDHPDTNA